jgi:ectoine hydroxylase-related dioxygenase (phytanoyl-CoA dioxygenase family)
MNSKIGDDFLEQGYVIIRHLLSPDELQAIRDETGKAIKNKVPPISFDQESPETVAAVSELYKDEEGRVFRRLERVIDRGGIFEEIVEGPLARAIKTILPEPVFVCLNRHNMLMLKAPHNPAPIRWHQDSTIWNEGTFDHVSAIVAIDDFLPDNGCLEAVPGSHHWGPIGEAQGHMDVVQEKYGTDIERKAVKVDLQAGDAVLFHGLLLHGSPGNTSSGSRRSLTVAFFPGNLRDISTKSGEYAPQVRQLC